MAKDNKIDWPGKVIEGYENIIVVEIKDEKYLIMSENQYTEFANYVEELKASDKRKKEKLEQANKELEKAYSQKGFTFSNVLDGAEVALLLMLLAQQAGD